MYMYGRSRRRVGRTSLIHIKVFVQQWLLSLVIVPCFSSLMTLWSGAFDHARLSLTQRRNGEMAHV